MGFKRKQVTRRDENEPELLKLAKQIGALVVMEGPLDCWIFFRGAWTPCEIKIPEREGRKHEFTDKQVEFHIRCKERCARYWTWRTPDDVMFSLGARITA